MRDIYLDQQHRRDLLRQAENERLARIARRAAQNGRYVSLRQVCERVWAMRWRALPVVMRVRRSVDLAQTEEFPRVLENV